MTEIIEQVTLIIKIDRTKLEGLLITAEEACDNAVSDVGGCNYDSAEEEAHKDISDAFSTLRKALLPDRQNQMKHKEINSTPN